MIVPMKKYTFLVYHRHYTAFLQQLRETGVLHVKERKDVNLAENEDLRQRLEEGRRLTAVIRQLQALAPAEGVFAPFVRLCLHCAGRLHVDRRHHFRRDNGRYGVGEAVGKPRLLSAKGEECPQEKEQRDQGWLMHDASGLFQTPLPEDFKKQDSGGDGDVQ